jgi:putative FmdB family regulatory protein
MPIYEYEREDGSVFEVIQKISDEPLTECPETGQKVQRLISSSAFHLKGSGWYKTDYSSSGSAGTASSSSSGSKSESTSSDSSTDKKKSGGHKCGGGCACD